MLFQYTVVEICIFKRMTVYNTDDVEAECILVIHGEIPLMRCT